MICLSLTGRPCYIVFQNLTSSKEKKVRSFSERSASGKLFLSKTTSYTGTAGSVTLNKLFANLAFSFLQNNVTGFIFCFIIQVQLKGNEMEI